MDFFDSSASLPKQSAKSDSKETGDDDDGGELELQVGGNDETEKYEVTFTNEIKLGMLLERRAVGKDDAPPQEGQPDMTIVTMVIDGGAAASKGVVVGSRLLTINGLDATKLPYSQCLDMVKSNPRPLRLTFERSKASCDTFKGDCLVRKSPGSAPPSHYSQWKPAYFVVGGAVAKKHVLQFYETKAQYEMVVVRMFQNQPVNDIKYKAYALNSSFKLSTMSSKNYKVHGEYKTVKYFTLRNPHSRTKTMKLAAENPSVVHALHSHCLRFASQGV